MDSRTDLRWNFRTMNPSEMKVSAPALPPGADYMRTVIISRQDLVRGSAIAATLHRWN